MVRERARYWMSPDRQVEVMYARFRTHVFPMHIHGTYSFGVTEAGAQAFRCRGAERVSGAGMVMAFNPDDPHDGHAAAELGYQYRMVHIDENLVRRVLVDAAGRPIGLPLFAEPVAEDAPLASALRALHEAVVDADWLAYDERVAATVTAMVRRRGTRRPASTAGRITYANGYARAAARARRWLEERPTEPVGLAELADIAGCSRYALYRAFRTAYGIAPSDFHRQLRLRVARELILDGLPLVDAALRAGFADQSHLTRWFTKVYGVSPGDYRRGLSTSPG